MFFAFGLLENERVCVLYNRIKQFNQILVLALFPSTSDPMKRKLSNNLAAISVVSFCLGWNKRDFIQLSIAFLLSVN